MLSNMTQSFATLNNGAHIPLLGFRTSTTFSASEVSILQPRRRENCLATRTAQSMYTRGEVILSSRTKSFATLNTGAHIPLLGFGTYSKPFNYDEVKAAVSTAIEVGYRHFDTASLYNTENPLAEALVDAFKAGIVEREDVFVTSKLWCSDNHPDDVIPAIKKTLSALQLDCLDLYLIHWPVRTKKGAGSHPKSDDFLPVDIKGTWQVMEECVHQGLTKAIGVSNFSSKKIEDLLAYAEIPPAVNQVEMHPMWQQKRLRETCSKANILVSAWAPLARSDSVAVLDHPTIVEIALKHGKTPAQVALRWGLEQGVCILPKSFNKKRMIENFQIFDWQLTDEDHEEIGKMEQKRIVVTGEIFCNPIIGPYKNVTELWDGEI